MKTVAEIAAVLVLIVCAYEVGGAWHIQFAESGKPPVDFTHFYALGYAGGHSEARAALVDNTEWRRLLGWVAPDAENMFPRVYGPQTALFFAPWSWVPMPIAYVGWGILSWFALGLCVVRLVRESAPALGSYQEFAAFGILAFPAMVHTVVVGHAGGIAVVGVTVAAIGLARGRPSLAGLGMALLSVKPTLFLPAVAVALLGGEIAACAMAGAGAIALLLVTLPVLGIAPLEAYAITLIEFGQTPDSLAKPSIMASLRTLCHQLMPDPSAEWAYTVAAIGVILAAAWAWRRTNDALERISVAVLATVLASPHVFNYDLVITLPAFVLSAAWVVGRRPGWKHAGVAAVAAYAAPVVPIVVSNLPVSVTAITSLWWFCLMVARVGEGRADRAIPDRRGIRDASRASQ